MNEIRNLFNSDFFCASVEKMSSKNLSNLTRILSPIIRRKTVDSSLHVKQTPASSFIQKRKYYEQHYEGIVEADPTVRGIELLRDPRLNKVILA